MGAKLFVANLNPRTTRSELASFLSAAGRVMSVTIPTDRVTNRPRGFAFVEFSDRATAEAALDLCDGRELAGHALRLSWARERDEAEGDGRRRPARRFGKGVEEDDYDPDVLSSRGPRGSSRDRDRRDDLGAERRPRRHGKHGSDRKRGRGTRRLID